MRVANGSQLDQKGLRSMEHARCRRLVQRVRQLRRRRHHRRRCDRTLGGDLRCLPNRVGGRSGYGNSLRAWARAARHRGRHHEPLSAACTRGKAQCGLHAAVVPRGCACARPLAHPRRRGLRPEGSDRRAGGGLDTVRSNSGQVHRRRHRRENPLDRAGDRIRRARRIPGQIGAG